ncbi:MAG: DUF5110 domain-containing protein, partial [Flavobacterium sp.]|nr:DUF5110 domain-containing protein [Flavobacterium sp.]
LGGFAGDYFDNELYIRWLQYGVFNPIFRPHAQEEVASEAVYKDIVTREKAKKIIELRYQMLPYNYTLSFENNQTGMPLMRPLLFEERSNSKLSTVCESYFWGNNFLVTPITTSNVKTTAIYFPKNNNWFDFYSDKKYLAGTTINVNVSEDNIPTFVRGGSFIPLIQTIQNTAQYSLSNFDLHYYFDEKTTLSSDRLYNDDGITPNAFEKEKFEILNFESKINKKTVVLKLNTEIGKSFESADKNVNLIIHNIKPKKIIVDGKPISFKINKNVVEIPIIWLKMSSREITIQF